jgi:RNA polymerase-binding protein DksA
MVLLEAELKSRQALLREGVREEKADSDSERDRRRGREVQDRGDEANTDQWRETNAAMIDHNEVELQGIQAALSRMASGTYGLCVNCGEPMGFERLQAWPLANRCLDCQSQAESG